MAGFTVDPDAVKDFGGQVFEVGADLASSTFTNDLSDAETGDSGLTDALNQFHANWKTEQEKLLDSVEKLGYAIRQAAEAYQQADDAVSNGTSGAG